MSDMKPILFNTDMVRAILEDRKTVTRRVVKLKYSNTHLEMFTNKYGTRLVEKQNEEPGVTTIKNPDGTTTHKLLACIEKEPPYHPGDILYVRETWAQMRCFDCPSEDCEANIDRSGLTISCNDGVYIYRATDLVNTPHKWRPSIHMPREAARIFLRVTDVRVERLRDMPHDGPLKEGIRFSRCPDGFTWKGDDEIYCRYINPMGAMKALWDSAIKSADLPLYGWDANPWVWVIGFERIGRAEAGDHAI